MGWQAGTEEMARPNGGGCGARTLTLSAWSACRSSSGASWPCACVQGGMRCASVNLAARFRRARRCRHRRRPWSCPAGHLQVMIYRAVQQLSYVPQVLRASEFYRWGRGHLRQAVTLGGDGDLVRS